MSDAEQETSILVNGEEVPSTLIEQELQHLRERYSQEMSWEEMDEKADKIESDARENAVERLLLSQKSREAVDQVRPEEVDARFFALKEQYGGEEAFDKQYELDEEDLRGIKQGLEESIRLEKYFELICAEVARPTGEDSKAYYEEHAEEFRVPELVHAAHIIQQPTGECPVEKVYADLLNIRERLIGGEEFSVVADEVSQCGDGGHDLGYFARGQMVPGFEEVAFSTDVGGISDVFQTEFGYHILTVIDKKPEMLHDYEEVRYDIESMLFENRKNDAIGVVADELRATADIQNLVIVED